MPKVNSYSSAPPRRSPAEQTNLLTPRELADHLGIAPKTLTNWRYLDKGPPALKVGKFVRYRAVDVERWVEGLVRLDAGEEPKPRRPKSTQTVGKTPRTKTRRKS